jgi:hypothetical protein
MKPKPRSRRRMDLARMKAKARRIYPHDKRASLAEHLAFCSGPCCGNPRRWNDGDEHLPPRERRLLDAMNAGRV